MNKMQMSKIRINEQCSRRLHQCHDRRKEIGATNNGKDHLLLFEYYELMICYLENIWCAFIFFKKSYFLVLTNKKT